MKIAFTYLTYGKDVFGGVENALFNLTKGLNEIGHKPVVFTSATYASRDQGELPAEVYISRHLPTKYDGNVSRLMKHLQSNRVSINKDFDRFVEIHNPDHIIVVDPIWGILEATGHRLSDTRPVSMSYHVANAWPETKEIMRASLKANYRNFFVVSSFLQKEIGKEFPGISLEKMKVLPNSIDTPQYSRAPHGVPPYIFCNSRIAKGKNVGTLIKAFNTVHNNSIRLVLCAGASPFNDSSRELQDTHDLIDNLGLKKQVELLPNLSWHQIPDIVSGAYAVVLPSAYETFGIAAIEASVAGIPLVVADATNFKHIVKKSAQYFELCNDADLAKKLHLLLNNYQHYKDRAVKCKNYYIESYDNKQVARKLVDAIRSNNML